ncbi:MAG: lipid-A-disaccharide synthase [Selenomonadaceae bacterium]|nr:lipid-A-disaccharide synthase [Selenomonadaceae bacterium]
MKIMMSAGEASGDVHGAGLAREIKRLSPSTEIFGFGGNLMATSGVRLVRDYKDYNVMGVVEVIKNLRRIFKLLNDLTEIIDKEKPDLLVLIDYPDFNWRLAKRAKKLGVKILSYIPPSAWAWRKGRAKSCAAIANEFIAIFPFELPVYQQAGAKISFLGNPLVDTVKPTVPASEARKLFGVTENEHVVLLMPGSRRQEIKLLLQPMLESAALMSKSKAIKFFLPVADSVDRTTLQRAIDNIGIKVTLIDSARRYDLMSIADAAIATSGTVVLEAALLGLPCVVLYKMAPLNFFIGKLLVDIKYFSLPNILANDLILTELLQDEVTPERITEETVKLLRGEENRLHVVKKLESACAKLGGVGAATRIAQKILQVASSSDKKLAK